MSVEKGSVDWLIIETIAEIEIRLGQREPVRPTNDSSFFFSKLVFG